MKNKLKHIIALFLVILMSLQTVAFVSAEEEAEVITEEVIEEAYVPQNLREYRILNALDVFTIYEEKGFTGDAEVSRAETAAIAASLSGLVGGFSMEGKEMPFTDVDSKDVYAYEIYHMNNLGVMTGYNGEFNPDATVTEEQFLKVIVEVLGYGYEAGQMGGYPHGYSIVAGKYHVLDDVSFKGNVPLTQDVAVRIVYNSLFVEMPRVTSVNNDGGFLTTVGHTILSRNLNVARRTGILKRNPNTYLEDTDGAKKGVVQIDDEFYYTGKSNCEEYLGYNVDFFYRKTAEDEIGTILYAEPFNNEVLRIEASEITGFANNTYTYYKEGFSNEKRIKYPLMADLIYNDVSAKRGFNSFVPEIGYVEFIDNNADGEYEVVSIKSYDIYYIKSNNKSESILTTEDNKILPYEDAYWNVVDAEGKKLTGNNVVKDTLLLLAVNEDRDVITGFQVDDQVDGKVEATSKLGSQKIVTINGVDYRAHSYCAAPIGTQIKSGDYVGYFVYGDMLLVKCLPASSLTESVGYVIEAGSTGGLGSKLMLRMLLQTGDVAAVEVADNAKLVCYGRTNVKGDDYAAFVAGLTYQEWKYDLVTSTPAGLPSNNVISENSGDGRKLIRLETTYTTVRQPVIYKLNEAGQIIHLEIAPDQNSDSKEKHAVGAISEIDKMQLVSTAQGMYSRFFPHLNLVGDENLVLDKTSYVISVPDAEDWDNYDAYSIKTAKEFGSKEFVWDTRLHPLKSYRTGNDIFGANIVVGVNIAEAAAGSVKMIVDKIMESVTDDGIENYTIIGKNLDMKDVVVKTDNKAILDSITEVKAGVPATITAGDYIKCSKNSYGLATKITLMYDRESAVAPSNGGYIGEEEGYLLGGQVFKKKGDVIAVYSAGVIPDGTDETNVTSLKYLDASPYRIVVFDSTLDRASSHFINASVGEIKAYLDYPLEPSNIMETRQYGTPGIMIIYR